MKKIFVILMLLAFFVSPAFAIGLFEGGVNKGQAHDLDFIGANVGEEGQGGQRTIHVFGDIEQITTNDTLTAAEAGKVLVVTAAKTQTVVVTLPDAEADLQYTIICSTDALVRIAPQSGDLIVFTVGSTPTDAGDRLQNNSTTNDSITLVSPDSSNWYVRTINGTWTDIGQ